MTDGAGAALFAKVLEAPLEKAPRLVYADWLLEQGDPWGEFIQLQCRGDRRFGSKRSELDDPVATQRERELFLAHARDWIAPIRPYVRQSIWEWGFVAEVTASGPTFFEGAEKVFAAHPLKSVQLENMTLPTLERFPEVVLGPLPTLRLTNNRIGPRWASAFTGENLAKLRRLCLEANPLGDGAIEVIASSSRLGRLQELSLGRCTLGDAALRAIAKSPVFEQLEFIDLRGNPAITSHGAIALAESTLPKLASVGLHASQVEALGADAQRALRARVRVREQPATSWKTGDLPP